MAAATARPPLNRLRPRLRVYHGTAIALGPGKADLLAAIAEAGTLAEAARRLEMSYMRAWSLVRTMNACFEKPLVERRRGGAQRGAAVLTEEGRRALALYRRMERQAAAATRAGWRAMARLLRH